MKVVSVTQNV